MKIRLLLSLSLLFVLSCSTHNDPINRVIDDYYDKAHFNQNWESGLLSPEWYYRMTVVDTAPNSQALGVGDGHWLELEKIRWEITDKYLVGWRSKPSVEGTEAEKLEGGEENYKGAPVVAFEIDEHFDIAPDYDPMTGAKGNILSESKTQSWFKRRFFKINFSKNVVEEIERADKTVSWWGSKSLDNSTAYTAGQKDPANPNRTRIEKDYIEFTTRQGVKADLMGYYGRYGEAFAGDSSAPIIDIRYSFMRVPESKHYKPLNYSDDMFDQFGFYRIGFVGKQVWDKYYGSLETNKNKNITRFNIWNADRSPKPIIYYTSVSHPRSLLKASRRVESEWNQIFKELVFEVKKDKYKDLSEVPNMWVLYENNCNINNLKENLTGETRDKVEKLAHLDLDDIAKQIDWANESFKVNQSSFTERCQEETAALEELEKLCSAFEYVTQGSEEEFKYQRAGDLRFNLLNLLTKRALTRWSGLGPMFADPDSGEILQSTANVNLWYIDKRTQSAIDQIDLMTGKTKFRELILGTNVQKYMQKKMQKVSEDSEILPNKKALEKMEHKLKGRRPEEINMGEINNRLELLSGDPKANYFSQNLFIEEFDPLVAYYEEEQRLEKSWNSVEDPPEFLDNLVVGIALQTQNQDPKEKFMNIREDVYTAVMLHEVGHNMGLAHNMAASADPINYGKTFWEIQEMNPNLQTAIRLAKDKPDLQKFLSKCLKDSVPTFGRLIKTQDCMRQTETMYSSIMDYHASWNADVGGLGPYDKAAIFFGYGQLVEVIPEKNLRHYALKNGLKGWLKLNDWKQIPRKLIKNSEKINEREWVSYQESESLYNRVPYKYCLDGSGTQGPNCKAFDFGPDMRSRAARNQTKYWQHYFLTHFNRDRIWNLKTDYQSIISQDLRIYEDFNQIMRWYGYYALTDKNFKDSDSAKDYLAALASGLNHYSHVIGLPVSGKHLTTLDRPSLLSPIDEINDCEVKSDIPQRHEVDIMLGDGRPFSLGLNTDYEDKHINYVGSFYSKLLAGYFLAYPGGSVFPRVDTQKDPRLFSMNWYRLFPKEVSELFSKLIRSDWENLGPLTDQFGELIHRNLIDPQTFERPNYDSFYPVIPTYANMLPFRSLYYASALLSAPQVSEFNLIYSMKIHLEGAADDRLSAHESSNSEDVARFENPDNGNKYWAPKAGYYSPIAYDLLLDLNKLKSKEEEFKKCLDDQEFRKSSPLCKCFKIKDEGGQCILPIRIVCSEKDLIKKYEQSKNARENGVGFVDDVRWIVSRYSSLN